jgi:hypothetical protein
MLSEHSDFKSLTDSIALTGSTIQADRVPLPFSTTRSCTGCPSAASSPLNVTFQLPMMSAAQFLEDLIEWLDEHHLGRHDGH